MHIPKYYTDNHGFALDSYKTKLLFSKAIFTAENEDVLKALQLETFWLGYDPEIKKKETVRIAFLNEK